MLGQLEGDVTSIKNLQQADVEMFKDKFPFNLKKEEEKEMQKVEEVPKKQEVISVKIN